MKSSRQDKREATGALRGDDTKESQGALGSEEGRSKKEKG